MLVVIAAMTVEMAMGFAVATCCTGSRSADMTDMATDLQRMSGLADLLWLAAGPAGCRGRLLALTARADRVAAPVVARPWPRSPWRCRGSRRCGRPAWRCRSWPAPLRPAGVDALSALVVPAVAAVALLVLVFAAGEIRRAAARFHGLMLLFARPCAGHRDRDDPAALLFGVGGHGCDSTR